MTPRPPTHREPTDEEMQCLPEGSLNVCEDGNWKPSNKIGRKLLRGLKSRYAVPITKQEDEQGLSKTFRKEAQEPRKTLRDEFAMAALTGLYAGQTPSKLEFEDFVSDAEMFYQIADAMLSARNNQPEKV